MPAAALLILVWVLRKALLKRCWESETVPEGKMGGPTEATSSVASEPLPPPAPVLQLWVKASQQASDKAAAERLGKDVAPYPLSMTEIVTMQGGQVSNNALWEQQGASPVAAQPLSVSSVLTTRRLQPESDDSQGTAKGMLFSASTAAQTLPSSTASQPCACMKGRLRRTLNWSLAVRVCDTTDITCLPSASPPQPRPATRGAYIVLILLLGRFSGSTVCQCHLVGGQ